jgi:hypothetical protein
MIGIETVVIMIIETEETVTSMIIETEIKGIENTAVVVVDNKKDDQEVAVVMVIIQVLGKKLTHRHNIIDPHQHETPRWQMTRLYQMVVVVTVEDDSIVEVECLVVEEEMTDVTLEA